MLALSDHQLEVVMGAAQAVPVEKRDLFLQRIAAMITLRGCFTDADVHDVVMLAMCGLAQTPTAA